MIYSKKYQIKFYQESRTAKEPVLDYINSLNKKDQEKINKYIDFLREHNGYIEEPYGRHIKGAIRELRVDFFNNHHRILYFCFINQKIILLSAFLKNTDKTPIKEIIIAENRYQDTLNNPQLYE